jgi:predicted transposase/invertase (TIGR01784 family)
MVYGVSKTVGEPYRNIKKIYSINIVYFDLGQGLDYIYHGKTDFIGIHINDKLELSAKQTELLGKEEPYEIFPEYYVIKVNQFNDIAKDTLDEWIYYLKNNEIKDGFTAKGISKARELWRLDTLSDDEQKKYQRHLEDLRYGASMAWTMKVDEEDRIRKEEIEKGETKNAIKVAGKMRKKGMEISLISEMTGLTKEEIEKL